jgi:galactose oxidase
MNWYDTNGNGSYYPAGTRTGDGDAMNGNAVMFDAVQGLILTLGGAPSYQARPTSNVNVTDPVGEATNSLGT